MDNSEQLYNNPIAEPEHKDVPIPEDAPKILKRYDWYKMDTKPYYLNFTEKYTPPRFTLQRHGIKFANVGDLHVVTGKPGNGKTGLMTIFMSAILGGKYGNTEYALTTRKARLLYVDTEMNKDDTIAVKNRVCVMSGRDYSKEQDDFAILRLREVESEEDRWCMILKAIWEQRPTDIFIDGMLDIVKDYNDQVECQPIIRDCMILATYYDASMWLVLHENPLVNKLVGTLGSITQRKVTEIFEVVKIKQEDLKPNDRDMSMPEIYFRVNQMKARSKDVDKWFYKFTDANGWGQPEEIDGPISVEDAIDSMEKPKKYKDPDEQEVLNAVSVIGTETMSLSKLREKIKEQSHVGSTKAKEYIDIACTKGFLTSSDNKYTANPPDRFAGDEYNLPF